MNLFEHILKEMMVLNEGASINDVNYAISNMHPAIITYTNNEGDEQANGKRMIYPIAYGMSTAGNPVIRAFEYEGDTTTKVPAWKLFILPNIKSWKTLDNETFKGKELKGVNKTGKDKQMAVLYNVSPLSDLSKKWISNDQEIKSVPVEKDDIDNETEYSAVDMADYSVSSAISKKNIDNTKEKDYFNSRPEIKKITADPNTTPIASDDIEADKNIALMPNNDNTGSKQLYANDDPVDKQDVNGDEEPEIKTSYDDLMKRWDNTQENNI